MAEKSKLTPESYDRQISGIRQHQFKRRGDKPLNKNLTVKIEEDVLAALKEIPGWQDLIRERVYELTTKERSF